MPVMELDFTIIAAIWMGGVIILVPLIAFMARFGIAPLLDAVARLRAAGAREPYDFDGRFVEVEARVRDLGRAVARLEQAEAERHAPLG